MLPLVGSFPSTFLMGDLGFDGKTLEVPNHGVPAFVWGESLSYWDRLNRDRSFCYHDYKQSCVCCVFIVFVTVFILYNFNTMFFFHHFLHFFPNVFLSKLFQTHFFFTLNKLGENSRISMARKNDGQVDCARHIPAELENTLLMLRWWGFRVRVGG